MLLLIAPVLRGLLLWGISATTAPKVPQSARSFQPAEVLRSPAFWILYVMFVLVPSSGLMATAQIAPIAKDYGLSNTTLFLGASMLSVALVVDNVMNSAARPFFGWVSDQIGRGLTMAIAFSLGACSYALLAYVGSSPWTFVVAAAFIFFTWGEIFSLFPSTCTDLFGTRYATAKASLLYTAKGTSAWLVPLANVLKTATGSWHAVFVLSAVANGRVVLATSPVLRPLRATHHRALTGAAE